MHKYIFYPDGDAWIIKHYKELNRHLNLVCEHHDVIDVPITPENSQRQNRMHEHAKEQGDI